MKSYPLLSVIIFFHFLYFQRTRKRAISSTQWQEDIKYFQAQLVKRHKNAFYQVSKEEFEKDVQQLYNDVPSLKEHEVIVRLMQITAKVGDGHTGVHMQSI